MTFLDLFLRKEERKKEKKRRKMRIGQNEEKNMEVHEPVVSRGDQTILIICFIFTF
jgi:hypothetical protein